MESWVLCVEERDDMAMDKFGSELHEIIKTMLAMIHAIE